MQRMAWQQPHDPAWQRGRQVIETLRQAGYQGVFVGGCVRDQLFALPCHDVDVATDAPVAAIEGLFAHTVPVGRAFGVVIVVLHGQHIEVATFRSDGDYADGRRPTMVHAATESEDVQRRDFTINALVADPLAGEIRDHVGGLDDIRRRRLVVVGDPLLRLHEDRLRVLRGLRFAARFALTIDSASAQALRQVDGTGLSRERIWEEWDKALALAPEQRAAWWRLLDDYAQGKQIFPPESGVQWTHSQRLAQLWPECADSHSAELAAYWLLWQETSQAMAWLAGQPLSKARRQRLAAGWAMLGEWLSGPPDTVAAARSARAAVAPTVVTVLQALGEESSAAQLAQEIHTQAARGPIPRLVDGDDLRQLGLAPGPAYQRLLRMVEDAWLAGLVSQRREALDLARRQIDEM